MKIFISGKVSGLDYEECLKIFAQKEKELLKKYTKVINPTTLVDENASWAEAMDICLKKLNECEAIYMLSNWKDSEGAKTEWVNARVLGLEIIYEKD